MADLDGQPLDRGGDDAERGEEHGVPVARDHLGGDRLRREAHGAGDVLLDPGVDVGEGPDRARDGAGGDLGAGGHEAGAGALELDMRVGELDAEGGRLGVDAV